MLAALGFIVQVILHPQKYRKSTSHHHGLIEASHAWPCNCIQVLLPLKHVRSDFGILSRMLTHACGIAGAAGGLPRTIPQRQG